MADKPKYLSKEGLLFFWTAIKNKLSLKADKEELTETAAAIRREFNEADGQLTEEITQAFEDLIEGLSTKEDTLQYGTATAEDVGKTMMPKTVTDGKVTSWEFGEAGKVDDVQVNGTSILENKVANIPIATDSNPGVVKVNSAYGVQLYNNILAISPASTERLKGGADMVAPVTAVNQHASTFYGLARAAGDTTQSASNNAVGTYTNEAKSAIQSMLGVDEFNLSDRIAKGVDNNGDVVVGAIISGQISGNNKNIASGVNAHAEGGKTTASGPNSHTEGYSTIASGALSHAEGWESKAEGFYSHAEGVRTIASGEQSHAEGWESKASNSGSHAEGGSTIASGAFSHAEGGSTIASESHSHAEGAGTIASNYQSHAEGSHTTASGAISHAEGNYTTASGAISHAEGNYTIASGAISHAEGNYTIASGDGSFTEGNFTNSTSPAYEMKITGSKKSLTYTYDNMVSFAIEVGKEYFINNKLVTITDLDTTNKTITINKTLNENTDWTKHSVFVVKPVIASGENSHAEGKGTTASGICSHAEGNDTTASGGQSHAEGYNTVASGIHSHAEGGLTQASGIQSHAEGNSTISSGVQSHAEGGRTIASGAQSHAEGVGGSFTVNNVSYISEAKGTADHIEGYQTRTESNQPGNHAEGYQTAATGGASHSEGGYTLASGNTSHAEGNNTVASGAMSHAEGTNTVASGIISHAEGEYTIANHRSQHVFGGFNIEDPSSGPIISKGTYVEIVGNGTADNARSNARTLDWFGNEVLAGKLTVGAAPTDTMDVSTKGYVDTAIADAVGDITGFEFQVVTELPVTGTKGIIYLRAHFHEDNDVYDEYIWVTDRYERLGTLDVDLSNYVTFDDIANATKAGVIKVAPTYGIRTENGVLRIDEAVSVQIKQGTDPDHPIVSKNQHEATFYGLAKSAGDTTQSQSSNAVGQYTDEAKSAIQSMLGVPSEDDVVTDVQVNGTSIVTDGVATVPIASGSDFGVVKVSSSYGLQIYGSGANRNIGVIKATDANIKSASTVYSSITPDRQHISAFYGLAKAAGDTTQSTSSNAVGTYTEEAKVAIRNMIDATGESASVTVTGTDPVIQASRNTRYICGEILSLDFTPCASGICEVIFTSGSSVTVLTLPETIKMPEWFEVETNHTYEISVVDGVYGAVMVW